MNRFCAVVGTFVFLMCRGLIVHAQSNANDIVLSHIEPIPIGVSCEQTTNIIFPFAIKSVDRGSAWVLAQKAKGAENELQLKAGRRAFSETNVTVICADGQLYSFLLEYMPFPSSLNIKIDKNMFPDTASQNVRLTDQPLSMETYETVGQLLVKYRPFLRMHRSSQLMTLHLKGIYLTHQLLWFSSRLVNGSLIDFTADHIRFFIRDKKRSKRTAVQEKEITPVYSNTASTVSGKHCQPFVFAFRPFTLPKSQQLFIQVTEKNGGRQLTLRIKPKMLLKARSLK